MRYGVFAIGLLTGFSCYAQGPAATRMEFEVASVKLVDPPMGPHAVALRVNHGLARLEGATLRQIIVQAYLVQRVRVLGGPGWYDIDQYGVTAKAENPDATRPQIQQMLQTLLADRFKLAVHRETRMQTHLSKESAGDPCELHRKCTGYPRRRHDGPEGVLQLQT